MIPKSVARPSYILSIAIASAVLAFLPAKVTAQSLGPYLAATSALKELRNSAYDYQDAVSRVKNPKDPAKRKELVEKAQALGQRALKDADRLRKAIEKLEKKGGWDASVRYLKQLLARYEKLIKESSRDMPARSPVPRPEPPENNPPRVEDRPRGTRPPRPVPNPRLITPASNPAAVDRQVQQLILEIRLYEKWANDRFGRGRDVGLEAAMIESFRKHGATNTNVAVGWAFPIWVQTGSQMGNYPWRFFGDALRQFSLHLSSAKTVGEAEQSYLRYLKGVMKIWRRDRRKVAQWMNQLIDLEGQAGAALEPQTQPRFWTIWTQIQALGKRINENKAIKVKTFDAWKDSQRNLEAQPVDEKKRQPGSRADTRNRDGVTLTDDQIRGVLSEVKKRLKTQGMPSKWIDELAKDLPSVKFDASQTRAKDKVSSYDGTSNTICLDPKIGLKGLREKGLKGFTQEAFHAWYDMVPYWSDLWLTQNEEDAAAGYIAELMISGVQKQAVNEATAQAGGNVEAALRGIKKINEHFGRKTNPFVNSISTQEIKLQQPDSKKTAFELLSSGQYRSALVAYTARLKTEPENQTALYNAGLSAFLIGEYETAKKMWLKLEEIAGNEDLGTKEKLIQTYEKLKRPDQVKKRISDLKKIRATTKNEKYKSKRSFCRDQFVINGQRILVYHHFDYPAADEFIYSAHLIDKKTGRANSTFRYWSSKYTNAIAREWGYLKEGERLVHIDEYRRDGSKPNHFHSKIPLTYTEFKKHLTEILVKRNKKTEI